MMASIRTKESKKAAKTLREIYDANLTVPGVTTRDRNEALRLAISILEARAVDGEND